MFDFDASKLLIIGVVALIVIGPKDLPRVLRQVGQAVGKIRRMASDFQGQFMDAMKEADLADIRAEVNKLKDTAALDVDFDPVRDVRESVTASVAPASARDVAAERLTGASAAADPAPIRGAVSALDPVALEPLVLEAVEPAHHTPAAVAGAVHAVEPAPGARRRILVSKRRPPGDRLARAVPAGRGRPLLPPRREPRP